MLQQPSRSASASRLAACSSFSGRGDTSLGCAGAELQRPLDVGGAQAAGPRARQVVVVGRHQHHLVRRHVEHPRHTQVGGRIGLVGAEHLGRQDAVPGQAAVLRHVGQQADVAVGQRADHEARLQARQARHRVGPGIEAVPDLVEVLLAGLVEMGDAETAAGARPGSCDAGRRSASSPVRPTSRAASPAGSRRARPARIRRRSRPGSWRRLRGRCCRASRPRCRRRRRPGSWAAG